MFFGEDITVTGMRSGVPFRRTVGCRVVDNGFEPSFSDAAVQTERRSITAFVRHCDWTSVGGLPKMGDRITYKGGEYAVRAVNDIGCDVFTIGASQC